MLNKTADSQGNTASQFDSLPAKSISLIPGSSSGAKYQRFNIPDSAPVEKNKSSHRLTALSSVLAVVVVSSLFFFNPHGLDLMTGETQTASPVVTVLDPKNNTTSVLPFGPQKLFTNNQFFIETRDSFIDEEMTFLEIDLSQKQLRFFEQGVLLKSAEIKQVAPVGSWRNPPAGLYQVEAKEAKVFSNIGQAYLPWQIVFQGNLIVHGQPVYPSGEITGSEFKAVGIQIDDDVAKSLYDLVPVGSTVLVHQLMTPPAKPFVYEPKVPELKTPHYFVADIENGTILASSDLEETAPIASLTKLMTAVIVAEKTDIDGRIRVTSPTFVTSLIPRLAERSTVSVYSLLQLLLVESSNESAETLAGEIGRDDFVLAMNQKARQLGMMRTSFTDPAGLSADNTSSVGDLYRLAKYIYDERQFIYEITANVEVPDAYVGGEFSDLVNFNAVEDMENFIGGKVGETEAAGQTSVSLHRVKLGEEERVLVVILLGSTERKNDIVTLLNYVASRFQF